MKIKIILVLVEILQLTVLILSQDLVNHYSSVIKYPLSGQISEEWPRFDAPKSNSKYYLNEGLPPCFFNTQCICSNNGLAFGLVFCDDIHLGRVPSALNNTKVHTLSLRNNGLWDIGEHSFTETGLYRLEISFNKLHDLAPNALEGVERSLWELSLRNNRLSKIPVYALKQLKKLSNLDLSGNFISDVRFSDFVGISQSLKVLSLAQNSIVRIPEQAFRDLKNVFALDLSGNNIHTISYNAFRGSMRNILNLDLSDNLLETIPLRSFYDFLSFPTINLARNKISSVFDGSFVGEISLETLILDENQIRVIPEFGFKNYGRLNRVSLRGNPLIEIYENAFKSAKIKELYLHDCDLSILSDKSFKGLEEHLQLLDMSYNNLSTLPKGIFDKLDAIKTLSLGNNKLLLDPKLYFNGFKYTLTKLNLLGEFMGGFPMDSLKEIRNVRTLGLSTLPHSELMKEDFMGFGPAVEKLYLQKNGITAIGERAFEFVPGIKILDLSHNYIMFIHKDAFFNIGGGLEKLRINDGLAFNQFTDGILSYFTNLQELDLSNNRLYNFEPSCIRPMRNIRKIILKDNKIKYLSRNHFDGRNNALLEFVQLSFNDIPYIGRNTFHDHEHLKFIFLDDNLITKVDQHAFSNLESLEYLHLQGNDINYLAFEAFQTMPQLRYVDLSHNKLRNLNFDAFEQVGSLSTLTIDASYNKIEYLKVNGSSWKAYSSLKNIIFSHNNISTIDLQYFESTRGFLLHIWLDHNNLGNVSGEIFHNMRYLSLLDFSYNRIALITQKAFRGSTSIQMINFAHNRIAEIPHKLLENQRSLRVFDVSSNILRDIPDGLLSESPLEIFRASDNRLSDFPKEALERSGETLRIIDLSHNKMRYLTDSILSALYQLISLDVSHNRIKIIAERTFRSVRRMVTLDISNNPLKDVNMYTFDGLEDNLRSLSIANVSLIHVPEFRIPKLVELNMSSNLISFLPSIPMANMSMLRSIDLSHNQIPGRLSNTWKMLPSLRELRIQGNPLIKLTNHSLSGLERLEYLDMRQLPLQTYESGSLKSMEALKYLATDTSYRHISDFNLAKVIQHVSSLQSLALQVRNEFNDELRGAYLPRRLTNITIYGENMSRLSPAALQMVTARHLRLSFYKTSLQTISREFFLNLGNTRFVAISIENSSLVSISQPLSTKYAGAPHSIYLTDLRIDGDRWQCDCGLGWIESWLKDWRADICISDGTPFAYAQCESAVKSLRTAHCRNGYGKSIMEALKKDLECGTSAASRYLALAPHTLLALSIVGLLKARSWATWHT